MVAREIVKGVFSLSAIDWDRRYFDELIPLPEGTSYNAYLVKGERITVLIDTVDPTKKDELFRDLEELKVESIDYIVSNHAEQDHSGSIPDVLERYPEAKVMTNAKCKGMLIDHLHIPEERFRVVSDGEVVDLGGRRLKFLLTPWVHWPETMVTYLEEDGILFTCDFFGSHLATSNLYARGDYLALSGAKRYYAEIMMPFRNFIKKHIAKLENLEINIIAPSHGPIYREPKTILDAYSEWIADEPKDLAVVAYISMHDSTRIMAEHLVDALIRKGVGVKQYDLMRMDIGEYAMDLVDAATVVLATPTVLAGPHPAALNAAYLTNILRPKIRYFALMGSFGWGGRTEEIVKNALNFLNVEVLGTIMVKGLPGEEDLERVEALADEIAKRHKGLEKM